MTIYTEPFSKNALLEMQEHFFGDMVKGVVDIDRNIIAIDAELHSDLESLLLSNESLHENLWGINLYPELDGDDFLEFDSLINIRPSQGNRSRDVENESVRNKIKELINKMIL